MLAKLNDCHSLFHIPGNGGMIESWTRQAGILNIQRVLTLWDSPHHQNPQHPYDLQRSGRFKPCFTLLL